MLTGGVEEVALQVCGLILHRGIRHRLLSSVVKRAGTSEAARGILAELLGQHSGHPSELLR